MGRTLIALTVVLGLTFGMVACKEKVPPAPAGDAMGEAEKDAGKAAKQAEADADKAADDAKKAADKMAK